MTSESRWEQEAERWVRWARTPGHDAYWYYSPSFFDTIVPRPGRWTLEIGCGEGRVARDLARRGHTVVGLDTSPKSAACWWRSSGRHPPSPAWCWPGHDGDAATRPTLGAHTINDANDKCGWSTKLRR